MIVLRIFQHHLRQLLIVLCCLATSWAQDEPIHIQWADHQEWTSPTHVKTTLHIKVPQGYKLYGPAEAGDTLKRSPEMSWQKSKNVSQVSPHWPPTRPLIIDGQKAHVYEGAIDVPVDVFVLSRGQAHLELEVEGLACEKMCYPFHKTLSLALNPPALHPWQWLNMLFLAFLGGLVLNIMPCVLPVLGLKLRGLTAQSPVGLLGVMTTAGILCGFWLLALIIILFKVFFGRTIGWGMQLQSPLFSSLFAVLMIGAGYSLFGIFQLHPPKWTYALAGKNRSSRGMQFFFSGLLAVFLATPCSAPFLGPAVGFALTGNAAEIFLFYTCIALGFAFPYLLILILPVARFLPKPGVWMLWIEKSMGMVFLLSAGWFIGWPLSAFLSPDLQKAALGLWAALCLMPVLVLLRRIDPHGAKGKIICKIVPILGSIGLLGLPLLAQEKASISMQDGKIVWAKYDPKEYERHLRAGKILYIDATALGCALCMINKTIYEKPDMQALLTDPDVVCIRADYSHADPRILQLMQRHGRAAIPFNLLVSKHHSQGIVMRERLTSEELSKAITLLRRKVPVAMDTSGARPGIS